MKKKLLVVFAIAAVIVAMSLVLGAQGDGNGQDKITICHIPTAGHDMDQCGPCRLKGGEEGITLTIPRVAAVNGHDVRFGKQDFCFGK